MKPVLVLCLAIGALQRPAGAKTMFYDPGDAGGASEPAAMDGGRVKHVRVAIPFPGHGHVGIHYWFEDDRGSMFTDRRAAASGGLFTLHVRSNTEGFLSVWRVEPGSVTQLTPMPGRWVGYSLAADMEYVVPGTVQFTRAREPVRIVLIFGRSQTEQAAGPESVAERLATLSTRDGTLREVDEETPREIGTYVVNRDGYPVATEVALAAP